MRSLQTRKETLLLPQQPGTVCIACLSTKCIHLEPPPPPQPCLSPRELDVIRLVADCQANKTIAWRLHLSEATVKVYLTRIYETLGFTSDKGSPRMLLSRWAQDHRDLLKAAAFIPAAAVIAGAFRLTHGAPLPGSCFLNSFGTSALPALREPVTRMLGLYQ